MNTYRSPYVPRENSFVNEFNSGVYLTMPDMSKSVQEIIELSLSGQDPMVEYVPDRPYGQDLADMLPNVDELGVLDDTINLKNVTENAKDNSPVFDERSSNVDAVSQDQKEVKP